jgi:hypothetical protein
MQRLRLIMMVPTILLSAAGGALARQPGQFTNGGIEVPWKFEKHPLSVELTIRAAGGTMLTIACVPASRGAHVNQVFLKHMKDRPFATVASLELQINKRVFRMASDGVDRGILLSNTTKDGMAAVSDPIIALLIKSTRVAVSLPGRSSKGLAFYPSSNGGLQANFLKACRSLRS